MKVLFLIQNSIFLRFAFFLQKLAIELLDVFDRKRNGNGKNAIVVFVCTYFFLVEVFSASLPNFKRKYDFCALLKLLAENIQSLS